MMYLSKLSLDISNPSVRQALVDCQDMHRNIMKAFSEGRRTVSMLYRLVEKKTGITLYVFSAQCPDWKEAERNGYHLEEMKDISALPDLYKAGSVLRFNLLANPSKKVDVEGKKNSARVALLTQEERLDWLNRQGTKYGFDVLQVMMPSADKLFNGKRNGNPIRYVAVEFEGVLRITDGAKFWEAYRSGIGPEKAYGMGLLMLSKV